MIHTASQLIHVTLLHVFQSQIGVVVVVTYGCYTSHDVYSPTTVTVAYLTCRVSCYINVFNALSVSSHD